MPFDASEIGFEFSSEEMPALDEQREKEASIHMGCYYEYKAAGYFQSRDFEGAAAKTPRKAA